MYYVIIFYKFFTDFSSIGRAVDCSSKERYQQVAGSIPASRILICFLYLKNLLKCKKRFYNYLL